MKNLLDETTEALRIAGLLDDNDDIKSLERRRERAKNSVVERATRGLVTERELSEAPLDKDERDLDQAASDVLAASIALSRVAKKIGVERERSVKDLIKAMRENAKDLNDFIAGPLGDAQDEVKKART